MPLLGIFSQGKDSKQSKYTEFCKSGNTFHIRTAAVRALHAIGIVFGDSAYHFLEFLKTLVNSSLTRGNSLITQKY